MKIETQELEYCKVKVFYEADQEAVKAKVAEAITELRKLPIPGFRPGKAPDHAIKARAKRQIKDWVAKEMSAQAYDEVIYETKMKPIGYPQFGNVKIDDKDFSCEMTIMKKPEFELVNYKGMEVPRPHMDRDVDAQIEATLHDLRTKFGDVEPYKDGDFVEDGDQITMDINGSIDGEPFEGSVREGQLYVVGQKVWPEFDDNLLGMTPGEEREFDLVMPADAPAGIAGKTAHFKVAVHMGTKRVPCPLDDDLAKKVGLETFAEVREKIRIIVNDRIKNNENYLVRQQVANRLVSEHEFEVPSWLSLIEAQTLAAQEGIDWKKLSDENREVYIKKAEKNVRLSLILDSIRDKEPEAMLNENEALQALKTQIAARGVDAEKFVVENRKAGRLIGIVAAMKDEFALQWVVDQAKITGD
jgi:trigger factor